MYPDPLVVPPTATHKETFIILHGRGDSGDHFGCQLLMWLIDKDDTIRTKYPAAKFVFPTASRRRAEAANRPTSNQWFDMYSPLEVGSQCKMEERQLKGLRETSIFLHQLLHQEISIVGAENVILGGLSQGCASSLIAGLLWDGPPLRAIFGMCGWLPLRKRVEDIAAATSLDGDGDGNPTVQFKRQEGDEREYDDPTLQALKYLKDELEFSLTITNSTTPTVFRQTPIFLGHGTKDLKIPIGLEREAAHCLNLLGATVEVKEYEGLGHWYSGKMLEDVVEFLTRVGQRDPDDRAN